MKKAVVIVVLGSLVALGGGLAAWRGDWSALLGTSDESAQEEGGDGDGLDASDDLYGRAIHALGRLEPARGVLTVGAVMGDRVEELHIREGDQVAAGALLATLASRAMRQLEQQALEAQIAETEARRQAEAEAADARIRLAELNLKKAQSSQAEIEAQEQQAALAAANVELARKDLQRIDGLSTALVSRQEQERQRLLVKKAEAELTAARAALGTLRESTMFAQQAAEAELAAARAAKEQVLHAIPVASMKKKLEMAELQAEQTLVVAPAEGTVLRVFTRAGELVANKPILQMADLNDLICVAEVYEGDVPRIRVGQRARIDSRAFPSHRDSVEGTVERVGGMIASPELRSIDPFAPTDRHVVEVRIRIPRGAVPEAARLANLQVDVTIFTADESNDEDSPGVAQSRP